MEDVSKRTVSEELPTSDNAKIMFIDMLPTSPTKMFEFWRDGEDNVMCMSTVTLEGEPSSRMMRFDYNKDSNKFTLVTHAMSAKVSHIAENNKVTMLFWHSKYGRQIIAKGKARINTPDENEELWKSRTTIQNLTSWKSRLNSSNVTESDVLNVDMSIPKTPFFCGIVVEPHTFEFSAQDGTRRTRIHMVKTDDKWVIKQYIYLNNM
jgi:pyridoxine/pyridoxamine 5'-phosphate oxidase